MDGTLNIITKEFAQLRRDPFRLRLMLVVPVIQVILLGYAANLDVKRVPTAVYDADQSPSSRALVDRFTSSDYFQLLNYATDAAEAEQMLASGDVIYVLVIPRGFHADLVAGRTASMQGLLDGSDGAFAARSAGYAAAVVRGFSEDAVLAQVQRRGLAVPSLPVVARTRVWFNPELQSRWFLVPGILALILMVITTMGTAVGVVREKEIGTLEQLIVTPIRPYEIIIGKLIPNAVVGMVAVVLALVVMVVVFDVPIRGSLPLLIALCALFLLTTLGLGLLISTAAQTQQQAMMAAIFFVMLPMILLSGFVFPIDNMPEVIQWFTYLVPLRYFFVILRGLFLKGVGLEFLWDETLALLAFGIVILALSVLRFRKRL